MTARIITAAYVALAGLAGYLASPSGTPRGTIDIEVMGERVLTGCTPVAARPD